MQENTTPDREFRYVHSCDLNIEVQIKIGSLEGKLDKPSFDELASDPSLQHCVILQGHNDDSILPKKDLCVTCVVSCDGRKIGLPVSTSYKSFKKRWTWNEWINLGVKYNELSHDSQLAVSIWDIHNDTEPHCIGGTTIPFFSKRGVFRSGIVDLKVHAFRKADFAVPSTTLDNKKMTEGSVEGDEHSYSDKMRQMTKLSKKHRAGLMEKVDWLDRLTFREVGMINEREKRQTRSLFLMLQFIKVHANGNQYSIVFFEKTLDQFVSCRPYPTVVTCPDPETTMENLVETKHHILTRSARSDLVDRQFKPNSHARDALERSLQMPPSRLLTSEQRDLIWKFRFYLSSNKKALTKFLRSVNWEEMHEVRQASDLLKEWAAIDCEDALELLSADFSHSVVRKYAVSRLASAPPDELLLYLSQLVQALKYENFGLIESANDASFVQELMSSENSPGINSLPAVDLDNPHFADQSNSMECEDENIKSEEHLETAECEVNNQLPDLASFLIKSACKDPMLANYFYWYLKVEIDSLNAFLSTNAMGQSRTEQANVRLMYMTVLCRLNKALCRGGNEAKRCAFLLKKQQSFVSRLVDIMKEVMRESGNRKKKIEFLKSRLVMTDKCVDLCALNGLPLPLDPSVRVQSIQAESASLFNSNFMPCKLTFRTTDNRYYVTIFKRGDDLRQDQLVIQMIRLMDRLLRAENLDLRLTPYQVLATSVTDGFVQFIDALPLRHVIAEWSSIQEMLRFYRPSSSCQYGIETEVMENYVRSCAGYSVICYLLGIGDRHQHNLLLCRNGRLFHVDFGYILGRDPKPLPPAMKLTTEMINAMGGTSSANWQQFRRLCYTAFLHLRRHANVVLNLFSLMIDARIPDIALEPDKAVNKIQERFHLHLGDEEAVQLMQNLIDSSVSAKMPVFVDLFRDIKEIMTH